MIGRDRSDGSIKVFSFNVNAPNTTWTGITTISGTWTFNGSPFEPTLTLVSYWEVVYLEGQLLEI